MMEYVFGFRLDERSLSSWVLQTVRIDDRGNVIQEPFDEKKYHNNLTLVTPEVHKMRLARAEQKRIEIAAQMNLFEEKK